MKPENLKWTYRYLALLLALIVQILLYYWFTEHWA